MRRRAEPSLKENNIICSEPHLWCKAAVSSANSRPKMPFCAEITSDSMTVLCASAPQHEKKKLLEVECFDEIDVKIPED